MKQAFSRKVIKELLRIPKNEGTGILFEVVRYNQGEPTLNIQAWYTKVGEKNVKPGKRPALDRETLVEMQEQNIIGQALEVIENWVPPKEKITKKNLRKTD